MSAYRPKPGSTASRCIDHLTRMGTTSSADMADAVGVEGKQLTGLLTAAIDHGVIERERGVGGFLWRMKRPDPAAALADTMHRLAASPEPEDEDDGMPVQRVVSASAAKPPEVQRDPLTLAWRAPAVPVFLDQAEIQAGEVANADADALPNERPSPPPEVFGGRAHAPPPCAPAAPVCDSSTRSTYTRLINEACDDLAAQRQATAPARFALWSDGMLEIRRDDTALVALTPEETRSLLAYLERLAQEDA